MYLNNQIDFLLFLQNFRLATHDFFTPFFSFATSLGEYFIPFTLCAILYWNSNKKLGALIILSSSVTMMLCTLLKNMACIYRPWILDQRITPVKSALRLAAGYSFPSGHSALSVACWGSIALSKLKNKKILWTMVSICLLVAFSRTYLGVHTPQDVIVGLIVGILCILGIYKMILFIENNPKHEFSIISIISIIGIAILVYTYLKGYPVDYNSNGEILVNPEKNKVEAYPKIGFLLGSLWGWYIERHFINFNPHEGSSKTRTIRTIIGVLLLTIVSSYAAHFWHYFCDHHFGNFCNMLTISLFVTCIYPWCIKKHCLLNNKQCSKKN